jgi:seryl-tRNA(Sec) selenium transferase
VGIAGDAHEIESRLRRATPPIIGRIADGVVLLDLRTVPGNLDRLLIEAAVGALT